MAEPAKPNESDKLFFKRPELNESPQEKEPENSSPQGLASPSEKTNGTLLEERFEPNAYLGLGVDPVALEEKLHQIINGTGDSIDQLYLYLSPIGAAAWKRETALESYKAGTNIPVEEIVDRIGLRIQKTMPERNQLNIVALGSGQARQEQRIVQTLIRKKTVQKTNLFLVDTSYPMLHSGFLECEEVFSHYRREVKTWAVYQNFKELPQNRKFLRTLAQPDQINLITVLGCTFSNVDNESFFLRNTLRAFPSKTMLLIDIIMPWNSSEDAEEIKKNDPFLRGQTPWAKLAESRWAIPFMQHHKKVSKPEDMEFTRVLDTGTCIVKKSYTIEVKARVDEDEWTIQRFKCYDVEGLTEKFREEGWGHISTYPFYDDRSVVLLFQKT